MAVATELAQGHAQMIVRILVQGTAKAAVVQVAQIVMVVVIAEVANGSCSNGCYTSCNTSAYA